MLAIRSQRELSCEPSDRRTRGQIQAGSPSFKGHRRMSVHSLARNARGARQFKPSVWKKSSSMPVLKSNTQWEGSCEDFSHRSIKGLRVWSQEVLRPEGDHCYQTQGPRKLLGPGEGARWWPQGPMGQKGKCAWVGVRAGEEPTCLQGPWDSWEHLLEKISWKA